MAAPGSKQCEPIKTYTESLCCLERKDTVLLSLVFLGNKYSSEYCQTLLAVPHFSSVA